MLDVENKRAALIVDWSNFVSSCEGGAGRGEADQDNLITDKTHLHVTQTRHVTKSIFNLRVGLVTKPHTCAKDSLIESWL